MNELINSEKTTEVAEPLLKLDLQFFSDDLGADDGGADDSVETIDDNLDTPDDDVDDEGVKDGELADTPNNFKDDPQNQAFAQIRREKEAYEQQVKAMNAMIAEVYGDQGIFTFEQYQEALQAQQQEQEKQQYREAGLPEDLAEKLTKVDEVLQQAEQEKFERLLVDNFSELQKEYPDLVKSPEDIPETAWQKWNDGKTGLTLMEAYELVNKQAIREHLQASAKQSTLNKINSKEHIRGNGGEVSDDIDITSVPDDVMASYRQMFAKELRSGKMTDKDFVNHYKKSLKG